MIRFRKYKDINFFSYFSITNYLALICTLLSLFLPMLNNYTKNVSYSLLDILSFNYSTINILAILLLFSACLIFIINIFFQPSWFVYFLNVVMIVYLFISPVLINFQLLPLLNLHQSSLTLYVGSILVMISAMIFTIIEIYKVSIMNNFVNENIKEKRKKALENFKKSRQYKVAKYQGKKKTNQKPMFKQKKKYNIRKQRLKNKNKYKKHLPTKTSDYVKYLETIYKI